MSLKYGAIGLRIRALENDHSYNELGNSYFIASVTLT